MLLVCLLAGLLTLLDTSMVVAAVPAIRSQLGASTTEMQWMVAAYSLTFALALVPAGRFGDLIGRHRLFLVGLLVFSACSVIGGLAWTPWMVVVARLLQGVGAGMLNPQVHGLIQDLFQGASRARAIGWYGMVGGIAATLGPLIGGGILAVLPPELGWRVLLTVNLPLGFLLYWRARRLLSAVPGGSRSGDAPALGRFDFVGAGLLAAAILATLVPITAPTGRIPPVLGLGFSVVLVLALLRWEHHVIRSGRKPLITPGLATVRGFTLGTVTALLIFGAGLALTILMSSYLQESLGLSAWQAGLVILPSALASALTSSISGTLVTRLGRPLICWGLLGAVLAVLAMFLGTYADPGTVPVRLAAAHLLLGAAFGLTFGPNQTVTLFGLPSDRVGLGAGVYQLSQRVSATMAMPLCWGIFERLRVPGDPGGPADGTAIRLALVVVLALLLPALVTAVVAAVREGPIRGLLPVN